MRCEPANRIAFAVVLATASAAHAQTPAAAPPAAGAATLAGSPSEAAAAAPQQAPELSTDQLRPPPAEAALDHVPPRGVVGALEVGIGRGGADATYQAGLGYALMVGYRFAPITLEARLERYDLRDPVGASTTEGRIAIMSVAARVARGPLGLLGGVARVTQPVLSEVGADGAAAFALEATDIAGVGAVVGAGLALGAQRWVFTVDARAYLCVWEIERALAVTDLTAQPDGTWTYARGASDRGGGIPLTITAGLRLLL